MKSAQQKTPGLEIQANKQNDLEKDEDLCKLKYLASSFH